MSASLAIFLSHSNQAFSYLRTFVHATLCICSVLSDFHMPFYIAHSFFFRSQPKLHILSFIIALFVALLSCLFLTSSTFFHIISCVLCTANSVYLFMICLLPLEWQPLNSTLSNSPCLPCV